MFEKMTKEEIEKEKAETKAYRSKTYEEKVTDEIRNMASKVCDGRINKNHYMTRYTRRYIIMINDGFIPNHTDRLKCEFCDIDYLIKDVINET